MYTTQRQASLAVHSDLCGLLRLGRNPRCSSTDPEPEGQRVRCPRVLRAAVLRDHARGCRASCDETVPHPAPCAKGGRLRVGDGLYVGGDADMGLPNDEDAYGGRFVALLYYREAADGVKTGQQSTLCPPKNLVYRGKTTEGTDSTRVLSPAVSLIDGFIPMF